MAVIIVYNRKRQRSASPLWYIFALLQFCNLHSPVQSFAVPCGPLRSFADLCGPLWSFAVFSQTRQYTHFLSLSVTVTTVCEVMLKVKSACEMSEGFQGKV